MSARILTVFGIIATCVVLITSCASHKQRVQRGLQEKNARFVGMHSDELLKSRGVPHSKVQLSTEEEVWTYQSTKTKADTSFRMDAGRGQYEQPLRRPMISWTETVTFTIGGDGTVKKVSVGVDYGSL